MKISAIFLTLFMFSSASSALNLSHLQGDSRREYRSPQGLAELCVVPKKWPGANYKSSDSEKERKLCEYDFYTNVGVCPKYNSTNPGVLLITVTAERSKTAIDSSNCDVKQLGLKTEAKYKQSISCSHTPSILGYYQLSRILAGGNVPVSVIRTMDIRSHLKLTLKANDFLRGSPDEIRLSWAKFKEYHNSPRLYPAVFDGTQSQVYGALSDNIKNEERYTEISGRGSYDGRYQRFLRQKPFLSVASAQTIRQMLGTTNFTTVAQTVVQMKDVSDMILMDVLLNQQDRIGNIHYKFTWYFLNPQSGKLEKTKSDAKTADGKIQIPPEESRNMAGKQAVLIKDMLLKDNDCGVSKSNMMRLVGALEKVRHMSYQTYRRFLSFEQSLATAGAKDYFMTELLFSPTDYNGLIKNATWAKQILVKKCQTGEMNFDVDIETYAPGATQPTISCLL